VQPVFPVFSATIFDFNGVLVDDEHVHLAAFRDVLEPRGIPVPEEAYWDRYIGYDDVGAFRAFLVDSGRAPDPALVSELVEAKKPCYLKRAATDLRTFPGAADCVRRAKESGPVVIVSGALRDEIRLGLEFLGVSASVDHVISAEDTAESKPNPAGYLLARSWLEARGANASPFVIEDSLAGISAAKSAELACVAVAHSYPLERLHQSDADLVLDKIETLSQERITELYRRLFP
jgi:beta-phosphoglucomutase